jgi:hypothetical protein
MPSFQAMFAESDGGPINYRGLTLVLSDTIPVTGGARFLLVFEEVNSSWREGVMLEVDGAFRVNEHEICKCVVLWRHTAPREVEFSVGAGAQRLVVRNVWDVGNGVVESWHNGAAMIVEECEHGRRYRCNDGHPDEDFDDIVFRLERVG